MPTPPLIPASSAREGSPTLSPNLHLKTIVELLRHTGPDLGRRWLAALLLVPESERATIVQAVEARVTATFAPAPSRAVDAARGTPPPPTSADARDKEFVVVYPPRTVDGHVETIERVYEVVESKPRRRAPKRSKRA